MSTLDLSRWQFGLTTVYHFLFVPITIGMVLLVAILQTVWTKTGDEKFLRLTKFFGKVFLINFAMGVVTGIDQGRIIRTEQQQVVGRQPAPLQEKHIGRQHDSFILPPRIKTPSLDSP